MLKKTLLVLFVLLAALGVGIYFSYTSLKLIPLFDNRNAQWGIVASVVIGLILGVARGRLKKKNAIKGEVVTRHGVGSFISHWATGFGIFLLIYSGVILGFLLSHADAQHASKSIGFIPVFAQTVTQKIPPLNVHYFAVLMTLFGGFFFGADYIATRDWMLLIPNMQDLIQGFIGKYFLRRKWEAEDKYMSSQKGAFVPFAAIGIVMLLSGAVKVAGHVWTGPDGISANALGWATVIHDVFMVFTILYILVHVGMVVALGHWPAFLSWFTGTMPTKTVEHHHPVWYEKLTTGKNKS
jgi:cytochrome b subunit of formate dehydrogenase